MAWYLGRILASKNITTSIITIVIRIRIITAGISTITTTTLILDTPEKPGRPFDGHERRR